MAEVRVALGSMVWAAGMLGQAGAPVQWPTWVHPLMTALLVAIMIAVMVYLLRPGKAGAGGADFRILVDGEDVVFKGRFPERLEGLVADFLVQDCRIPGAYEVRGMWEEGRLVVQVVGGQAKMQEQRIRNFLKLHVKRGGE